MKSITKTEEDSPKKPIWESLLERGSCKKEEIKKKMEEKKIKDEKLDPECTFKPSLINQNQLQIDKPFYERQLKWLEDRKQKINERRDGAKDKSLEKCSFQPQLGQSPQIPEVDIRNTKGMDSFIQRQEKARKLKQEKHILLNNPYSHLSSEKKAFSTNQSYYNNNNHPISKEYESIKKQERIEFSKAVENSQEIETQSQTQQYSCFRKLNIYNYMIYYDLKQNIIYINSTIIENVIGSGYENVTQSIIQYSIQQ